jgi:proteasome lid subunit RPN8/RPN11/LysM repeat protein
MTNENNREFTIETADSTTRTGNDVQLPLNFVTHGELETDDVKVYIHQNTYNAIERFSRSDLEHELGSILFGEYSQYSDKMHVVISDHIEAKYTDATASTLTFTHETWDYIHKEHANRYPHLKILGWQHTHPGYGIFLSSYDLFIQQNFFNLPFQVAYVVDPKQNFRGFFQWKSGKIEKLKGYYVYDEVGKQITLDKNRTKRYDLQGSENSLSFVPKKYIIAGALMVTTALVGGIVSIGQLQAQVNEQTAKQQELVSTIASLSPKNVDVPKDTETRDKVNELVTKIDNQQSQINDQAKTIAELRDNTKTENADPVVVENQVVFSYYTVQSGDTLFDICVKKGIDYTANLAVIQSVNGLEDISLIYVGQQLLLPTPMK